MIPFIAGLGVCEGRKVTCSWVEACSHELGGTDVEGGMSSHFLWMELCEVYI